MSKFRQYSFRAGGSKLKSTAGEYADIYHQWTNDGHQFIWITDDYGWQTTKRPLRDTFDTVLSHEDYEMM